MSGNARAWIKCGRCGVLHYGKRLARAMGVCLECGHHHPVSAADRVTMLTDEGSFTRLDVSVMATDVLGFTDTQPYLARLARARAATGLDDAVLAGTANLGGHPVAIATMDFRFMGGSLGSAVGEMITLTAETALHQRIPFIVVTASGGARMQEGVVALLQMAKVSQAIAALREAGLLTVSVITDPTYGGVAASFATNCDVVVVEQGARMGFAGPRVIEQTIRQKLPAGFQTAQFLMEHGHIDAIQSRQALAGWLSSLLTATGANTGAATGASTRSVPGTATGTVPGTARVPSRRAKPASDLPVITDPALLASADPWAVVATARNTGRPTTLDYLADAFTGFVELHGDRAGMDCPALVAGFALLDGAPVAVVGHQKGHSTTELVARNFGMPRPAGYRKALRVMRLAAALRVPIVTIVDTPGAYPGTDAEADGQAGAIADGILGMFGLRTPIVTVITGEGGSGGALALAVADQVLMLERATYSVISPEGCSAILWGTAGSAAEAARALRITARELLDMGLVDGVLPEPPGGAAADPQAAATTFRHIVARAVAELRDVDADTLVTRRRQRFRGIGMDAITFDTAIREAAAV